MARFVRDLGSVHRRAPRSLLPSLLVGIAATTLVMHSDGHGSADDARSGTTTSVPSVDGAARWDGDVVLWFWSPACDCRREAAALADVAGRAGRDVDFVSVAAGGSEEEVRTFVEETGLGHLELLADPSGTLRERYGVAEQPSYVLIDDDGSFEVMEGELGSVGLASVVAALITT